MEKPPRHTGNYKKQGARQQYIQKRIYIYIYIYTKRT